MKYLCVCDGGNVRSHALAYHLKWYKKQEAIAAGGLHLSKDTMNMLSEWADRIVVMQPRMTSYIDEKYYDKVVIIDVGEDVFGVSIHPQLNQMVAEGAEWLMASQDEASFDPRRAIHERAQQSLQNHADIMESLHPEKIKIV